MTYPKNILTKSEKMEGWWGRLWRSPKERLFLESDIVKVTRWAYQKAYCTNFEQEGSYDLSSMFWKMTTSTNLLGTEVHEVQEAWVSQKDLRVTNWVAKVSSKGIDFFRVVTPTVTPNHRPQGHPFTQVPTTVRWHDFLPLVWERGPEWGDGGKSPADYALPPRPHLCLLPRLLHHWCRAHALTCPSF